MIRFAQSSRTGSLQGTHPLKLGVRQSLLVIRIVPERQGRRLNLLLCPWAGKQVNIR